jgi:hypothetical protein
MTLHPKKIIAAENERIVKTKLHPAIIVLLRMASKDAIKYSGHYGIGLNQAINNMLHDYGLTKEESEQIKKEINLAREEFEIYTV